MRRTPLSFLRRQEPRPPAAGCRVGSGTAAGRPQGVPLREEKVTPLPVKLVSWNIAGRADPWHCLVAMNADVALLQEAGEPPSDLAGPIDVDPAPWRTDGWRWPRRTAIAKLSDRVCVEWIEAKSLGCAGPGEFAVSRLGSLAAAWVTAPGVPPFVVVSMYSHWETPYAGGGWIVSDASAHRIVSDLSAFIGSEVGHRIVAAGDLNILHGHGEHGSNYWAARYATVFERMEALGLPFIGPQAPNGRQADPWPDELPYDSRNVPTYHTNRQTPSTATRQLDFVFASRGIVDSISVRALNGVEEWGPSDHCRLEITVS